MLPEAHRLRESAEFRRATRSSRRARTRTLVLYLADADPEADVCRIGFVVSRAVGNAVLRNRVRRRLRHLARGLLTQLPVPTVVVVRALPAAAAANWAELQDDLTRALRGVTGSAP